MPDRPSRRCHPVRRHIRPLVESAPGTVSADGVHGGRKTVAAGFLHRHNSNGTNAGEQTPVATTYES